MQLSRSLCGALVGLGLGCSSGLDHDRTSDACAAGGFAKATAGGAYFGLDTSLGGGPHVLRVDDGEVRIDGLAAALDGSGPMATMAYVDEVGREVSYSLCSNDAGEGGGVVKRCSGSRCEEGDVSVRPLTLHPSPGADEGDDSLVAEFHDAQWPPGPTVDLAVGNGFAVLARGNDGLRLIRTDVDEAGELSELAHVPTSNQDFYNDVKLLDGRYLLVASRDRGLVVLDAADPREPEVVSGDLPLARAQGHNVFVHEKLAYLARSRPGGGIAVVDVSDPTSPQLIENHILPGCDDVHDLFVTKHDGAAFAYVNCVAGGLVAFDLEHDAVVARYPQPFSHSVSVLEGDESDLVVFSSESFASGVELASWDAKQGFTPLGRYATGSAASVHNLSCGRARCLVSSYQEGWFELDLSDTSVPAPSARSSTWRGPGARFLEGASGIERHDGAIYVADTERGLLVYEPRDD